ncbi:DUF2298 domain-containing protein [Motilimonas sp. E26]|uniref:DUF2298 domain-containing protein n=1 Tax=Motilimonas sp. E26 TaxID=2865674 RepID=UPI001E453B2C|nr:DUF2298 domain-containing protein [Motilimonas sp. E26]MCE0558087.1 hypothetical protein [Motilimonas sp. E26]
MHYIYLTLTLGIIWLNLAGLTLFCRRWLPNFALARALGVLLFALVFFFVEHFVGLGSLNWLWPITSLASAYLVHQQKDQLKANGFWSAELVFGLAFLYAFIWRFSLPAINVSSERITDLYFISNYMGGDTLPPDDNWYSPHKFDFYYAFQHYLGALIGRIFSLDIGTTYNLSFCILMALPVTLAWHLAGHFVKSSWLKLLLVATLAFGGTGLSPLLHLVYKQPAEPQILQQGFVETASERDITNAENSYRHQFSNHAFMNLVRGARFTGSHDENAHEGGDKTNAEMAEIFFPIDKPNEQFELRVLPLENFGYQYFVGDYHPPIGGFLILLITLVLIMTIQAQQAVRLCTAMLGATVPLMLITNTWVFPLQGLLLCGWLALTYWQKQKPDWAALIGGGLFAGILVYPFLIGFTSGGVSTPVKLVTGDDHTPWARFVGMQWPVLALMLLALFDRKWRQLTVVFLLTFGLLLLISEMIYIDDPTGGKFIRTNTVMKWWGWIYVGALVLFGAICLGAEKLWIKVPAIIVLLLTASAGIDVVNYLTHSNKAHMGKLQGHEWFTSNPENRDMFNFLKQAPRGVVLENVPNNAYMHSSVYAIFNNKPVLMGWPSHLRTWHGEVPQVWKMTEKIRSFYAGTLGGSRDWLQAHRVEYVVFDAGQQQNWHAINEQIKSHYDWFGFNRNGQPPKGIWMRRQ